VGWLAGWLVPLDFFVVSRPPFARTSTFRGTATSALCRSNMADTRSIKMRVATRRPSCQDNQATSYAVSGPPCPPALSTIQHGPNRRCRKNFKTPLLDRPAGSAQEIATPRVRVRKRTLHLAGLPRGWTGWGSRDQKQAPWLGGFLHHTDWARTSYRPSLIGPRARYLRLFAQVLSFRRRSLASHLF
jgi:hypothetical protein